MNCFPPSVFWRQLLPNNCDVEDPVNLLLKNMCALSIEQRYAEFIPNKYNFSERFHVPVFLGKMLKYVRARKGNNKQTSDGTPVTESVYCK